MHSCTSRATPPSHLCILGPATAERLQLNASRISAWAPMDNRPPSPCGIDGTATHRSRKTRPCQRSHRYCVSGRLRSRDARPGPGAHRLVCTSPRRFASPTRSRWRRTLAAFPTISVRRQRKGPAIGLIAARQCAYGLLAPTAHRRTSRCSRPPRGPGHRAPGLPGKSERACESATEKALEGTCPRGAAQQQAAALSAELRPADIISYLTEPTAQACANTVKQYGGGAT